jgi:hypothetical protein
MLTKYTLSPESMRFDCRSRGKTVFLEYLKHALTGDMKSLPYLFQGRAVHIQAIHGLHLILGETSQGCLPIRNCITNATDW